ncbi:type VI secretion system Vgr family protein [Corticimicrobacter populi]|uniref:Gp5/Type VI secretion system Vgr protein OB-fold domain-containing protein n=1 Tax=Corticimicrobacter populi TaxID=2175229 RepID=A0A2V1K0R4_9BURK|nr:contractile injection system protein, VgrG/Pvc8 family [Corticimicrobacter populi]PWF24796.1 hypothetical protein DD235_00990 [Corticimicrobacter populi]
MTMTTPAMTAFEGAYVFTSQAQGFDEQDKLRVWQWDGEDALSRGYRFVIDLAQAMGDEDSCAPLLGTRATFAHADPVQGVRWHGIVTRLEQTGQDSQYRYLRVTLEPQWVLARLDLASRVHAAESATIELKDLVDFTLRGCGLQIMPLAPEPGKPADPDDFGDYAWHVSAEHAGHFRTDFVCQYAETAYAFLSRRLEHAGIAYCFEQGDAREKMVFLGDASYGQQPLGLHWRPASAQTLDVSAACVQTLTEASELGYGRAVVRDYLPENVALDLFAEYPLGKVGIEQFDEGRHGQYGTYGEGYATQDCGKFMARLRAEMTDCMRSRRTASGYAPQLKAGDLARVQGYPKADGALTLRVVSVRQQGRQPLPGKATDDAAEAQASTVWTGIAEDVTYRPSLVTPIPRIPGLVTAVVESDKGVYDPLSGQYTALHMQRDMQSQLRDYPYLNENGYYRIRFHFAENGQRWQESARLAAVRENDAAKVPVAQVPRNSGWVRMATPYAGSSGVEGEEFGLYLPLNEGAEVLVSFLNGDPDRPVIMGAVPNSDNASLVNGRKEGVGMAQEGDYRDAPNSKIGGLRMQGGNMLAFNNAEGQQTLVLQSPVADSYMVMGGRESDGKAQGILLHSEKHISVMANSKTENIAGKGMRRVYDLTPAMPEKEKKEEKGELYKTGKSFNLPWLKGDTGVTLDKPSVSAKVNTGVSASLSLDFALKMGVSFSGVVAADWSVGFSAKTDINFLSYDYVKKEDSLKIQRRKAMFIEEETKAGKSIDRIIRKESIYGSQHVQAESVSRIEAGQALVFSVTRKPIVLGTSEAELMLDTAVQAKTFLQSLIPDVSLPKRMGPEEDSILAYDTDGGKLDEAAQSSLLLNEEHAKLVGKNNVYVSGGKEVVVSVDHSDGIVKLISPNGAFVAGDNGSATIGMDGIELTTKNSKNIDLISSGAINLESPQFGAKAKGTMMLNANGLLKLG